ncbi:hypothetical protein [Streptomyces rubiginosohelvolus]|uniref:hypothetical protein n=1 Tax=Streptomyces rubiginosohelvolus TaxID=67362 RepID=UPI00364F5104
MPPSRIRRTGLAAAAATLLALTGLSLPAQADETPPPVPQNLIQDPPVTKAEAPPAGVQAWAGPGGAADPDEFTLAPGAMNATTTSRVKRLDAVLPKQGVQNLLVAANRTISPWCSRDPFNTAPDPDLKYCLQDDDSTSHEWIPQAMTGVSDARDNELYGAAGNIQLFASYDNNDPGRDNNQDKYGDCTEAEAKKRDSCNQKGIRITFVQSRTNPATGSPEVKYRHVLLGWTFINSANHVSFDGVHSAEGDPDADPDKFMQNGVHAGGMVWYGNFLYVADTRNGIRVFDMEKIMDLDPDGDGKAGDPMGKDGADDKTTTANVEDKSKVGRHNNVWYSYGYRYVMPQVAAWKFRAAQKNPTTKADKYKCATTGRPKASYLSLDRSTRPDRLLLGEYCRPAGSTTYPSTGRIASYPVAELEGRTNDVKAEGWANYLPLATGGAQGAVAHDGTLYVNESKGTDEPSNLWRYKWVGGELSAEGRAAIKTATGAEDLYYERGAGRLWSASEHWEGAVNAKLAEEGKPEGCLTGPTSAHICQRVLYAHKLSWVNSQP